MTGTADDQPTKRITDPVRRRAVRHWRIVALVYLLALTTGTHWPELQVRVGPGPPPDKVLHLLAFGGLTLLVWQCRLFKRIWQAGLACALWVLFDEWTQSLPILNRQSSWMDVTAGELGVLCGVFWNTATMPTGSRPARWRRRLFDRVVQRRLATWHGWIALGVGASVIGVVSATLSVLFALASAGLGMPEPALQIAVLIAFCLAFVFGVFVVFDRWWSSDGRVADKVCFKCGGDCSGIEFGRSGWGRCIHCGTAVHAGQWIVAPPPGIKARMAGVLSWFCLYVLAAAGSWLVASLMFQSYTLLDAPVSQHPLYSPVMLAVVLVASSIGIAPARQVIAGRLVRFERRCTVCGYNMQPSEQAQPVVICPECGAQFARISPLPVVGDDA